MEPSPDPDCIKYLDKVGFDPRYKHHIFNAIFCVSIIFYIARNASIRQTYKFNLIPLLTMHAFQDCAFAVVNSVPYSNCYMDVKTWLLLIFTIVGAAAFTIKPYFIFHSLIRQPSVAHYKKQGLIASIVIPIVFFILPAIDLICGVHVFEDQKPTGIMIIAMSLTNLGTSIYLIKTDQTCGSNFPLLIAIYEIFYAIPEMLKYSLMIQLLKSDLYWQVEGADDFMFIVMTIVSGCLLYWRNSKKIVKNEEIAFGNHCV
ncbi:hypothetical protein PRIPAC_74483 [Pristionchus pacificus]|uniref:Uncharacterized protein n=1 Tax=Pristionchus pacificus TaxID=54126 RepID=A0A2A6C704_PRIPA|nr:hypothetical protein PRIPAC_74483 [Pristionchus pacificus]|eukprot:PDM73886.1 hypothetical protein PRIPAC_41242 [Pristionchus pacificus]